MVLWRLSILLFAATLLCGCEGQKVSTEPIKAPVKKDAQTQSKGNTATVSEPP